MEIKNLLEAGVKQEIIDRINKLTPQSQRQWGKMDVAQMLAHCQMPIGVALGKHTLKRNLLFSLIGPLFKKKLFNNQPFQKNLPTDKSFKMADAKIFQKEKDGLINMVNMFSEENISNTTHPFFGKLTKEEWGKGTWKHLDHHLKQFGV